MNSEARFHGAALAKFLALVFLLAGCASDAKVSSHPDSGSWSIPIEGTPNPEQTTKRGD
jgi:hypothetical protein